MLSKLRPHLSYANVVSTVCLFVLLGGTAVAAIKITGKNVQNSSLTGADVKNSSLTGKDVKNKSLTPKDFRGSVQGPKGDTGSKGDQGPPGTARGGCSPTSPRCPAPTRWASNRTSASG